MGELTIGMNKNFAIGQGFWATVLYLSASDSARFVFKVQEMEWIASCMLRIHIAVSRRNMRRITINRTILALECVLLWRMVVVYMSTNTAQTVNYVQQHSSCDSRADNVKSLERNWLSMFKYLRTYLLYNTVPAIMPTIDMIMPWPKDCNTISSPCDILKVADTEWSGLSSQFK